MPNYTENTALASVIVKIDGIEVTVPSGTTILSAARQQGIHIPTLCDHPDLDPVGVCRICIVEIEGQRELQAILQSTPISLPKIGEQT
jgi:NADH-quinone oxidoreductase subunit G/[NiFe] hydrogenase diaphorase moiety small subunit